MATNEDDNEPGTGQDPHVAWQMTGPVNAALTTAVKQNADNGNEKPNNKKVKTSATEPPKEVPVFVTKAGKPVTHMDLLRSSIELDARRARLANGTATKEEKAAYEKASKHRAPQVRPHGWPGGDPDLLTSTENGTKPGEKPAQPVGSTKDLTGRELVADKASPQKAAAWSSKAQDGEAVAAKSTSKSWGPK